MSLLLAKALDQIPRVLGFIDRNSTSKTYGCADRAYWHYRTMDFANGRYQEACRFLALAYLTPADNNRFYHKEAIKDWALAAVDFWANHRHADGSVDESYPCERHFCATAFSLFAASETYLLLKEQPQVDLSSSGRFIERYETVEVSNQMACAATALYGLWQLSKDERWKQAGDRKTQTLLKQQRPDGTFNEYGGFDLGYDTITLGFLARIYHYTARQDVYQAAMRLAQVVDSKIDQDGYFDPSTMSRKTQFIYPYGFSIFKPDAVAKMEQGLKQDTILNPAWMDDRYCIALATDYVMASYKENP